MKNNDEMTKTNAENQAQLRIRKTAAYNILKELAQEFGHMQHSKDAENFDVFVQKVAAKKIKLAALNNDNGMWA